VCVRLVFLLFLFLFPTRASFAAAGGGHEGGQEDWFLALSVLEADDDDGDGASERYSCAVHSLEPKAGGSALQFVSFSLTTYVRGKAVVVKRDARGKAGTTATAVARHPGRVPVHGSELALVEGDDDEAEGGERRFANLRSAAAFSGKLAFAQLTV
jgi:hypothetical protein